MAWRSLVVWITSSAWETGTSDGSGMATWAFVAAGADVAPPARAASTSLRTMRPPGPLPCTRERSSLESLATFFANGEALMIDDIVPELGFGCWLPADWVCAAGRGVGAETG